MNGIRLEKRPLSFDPRGKWITTSSCGSVTGRVRRRTASSNWKIAVFAPMPSASDRMAAAAKPLSRLSSGAAYLRSCQIVSTGRTVFIQ